MAFHFQTRMGGITLYAAVYPSSIRPRAIAGLFLPPREIPMSLLRNLFGGAEPQKRAPAIPENDGARPEDRERLTEWLRVLRAERAAHPSAPLTRLVARAGELAVGSPYGFKALDQHLRDGGQGDEEPLTLSLTGFDTLTLVESCLALARCARQGNDSWEDFGREVERLRYRGGRRAGYASRLHYASEWITDNAARGNVRDMSRELGGVQDERPLRFMTSQRSNYVALRSDATFEAIAEHEKRLDATPRWVVPQEQISRAAAGIEPGDILGFATRLRGLDVNHTGIAYGDADGTLRVLHIYSASKVQISAEALPEYAATRKSTGILVARPI